MFTLILILVLLFGIFRGLKRGFILQTVHLLGFIIAFIIAIIFYKELATKLALWIPFPDLEEGTWALFLNTLPLESAFYHAISFAIIFFGVKIILQIIASMLDFVVNIPILKQVNTIAGAALGFIEVYLITFIVLFILALTPVTGIQEQINQSTLAKLIIEHTPFLSSMMESLWFTELLSIIF